MVGPADELEVGGLTIRGTTAGGVHTCLSVPQLGLMFDAGGGVGPGAGRQDRILVSHGHQDHLGGLPYLTSMRQLVGGKAPDVHLPREIVEPLLRIFAAWEEIEGFSLAVNLHPHDPEDRVTLANDLQATAVRSFHRVPSLAWIVDRVSHRLRPEHAHRLGPEIAELRRAGVDVTVRHLTPLLCVTGDTRIELFRDDPRLQRCKVLVHEVTGWDDRRGVEEIRRWGHTHVEEMIVHAERFEGEALVLVHRSLRHSRRDAEKIVRERFPAAVRERVHVFGH